MSIEQSGAIPDVTPVQTGGIRWQHIVLELTPQETCTEILDAALPPLATRRNTLLRVSAQGRLGVQQMQQLQSALTRVAPDFLDLSQDLDAVLLAHDAADLEVIDPSGGALRQTAEALAARAQNSDLSADDRRVAATALAQLFSFVAGADA